MKINYKIVAGLAMALAVGTGCKKSYLDTAPTNAVDETHLFETTQGGYIAINGIHAFLNSPVLFNDSHDNWGLKAQDLNSDMMGNDIVGSGSGYDWFQLAYNYTWTQAANYRGPYQSWIFYYRIVNNVNKILDHLDGMEGPQNEKDDIEGQSLAYRAFSYLRLTEMFQQTYVGHENAPGVPYYVHASTITSASARGTLKQDFDSMQDDILAAIKLLKNAPFHSEKSHINTAIAMGIASRIYLVMNDWTNAAAYADSAAMNYPLMAASQYNKGFNDASNSEWMWASSLTATQYNDAGILDFISFMDADCPGYASAGAWRKITKALYDQMSSTDVRKKNFRASDFMQEKFKSKDESQFDCDYIYMRSSEMYLNAAEAYAEAGNLGNAVSRLETLMAQRDPSYSVPASVAGDKNALITEIRKQRRIELWGEGFSHFDIMRWKAGLNRPTGPGNHTPGICGVVTLPPESPQFIYKVPQAEIDNNGNINGDDQNP